MAGRNKSLPLAAAILLAGGVVLVGWLGWNEFKPPGPPYEYVLVAKGAVGDFPALGLSPEKHPDLRLNKYELRLVGSSGEPLVALLVAQRTGGSRLLLDWDSSVSEPFINVNVDLQETIALAQAIRKHSVANSTLLAWWDVSSRLDALTDRNYPFSEHLSEPLILPTQWSDLRPVIREHEASFWGSGENRTKVQDFEKFTQALLADESTGVAQLREMSGVKEDAFLVIDLRDAYKLGSMYPEQFQIGFRDFPKGTDIHGIAGRLKEWLNEEGYESYAIQPVDRKTIRVYFLADQESQDTLLAKLLPFTTSNPIQAGALDLVYQKKHHWVYRLQPQSSQDSTQASIGN